jgi:hypothetical protein
MNIPSNVHNANYVEDIGPWTIYVYEGFTTDILDVYYLDTYLDTLTFMRDGNTIPHFLTKIKYLEEFYAVEIEKIKKAS